MYSVHDQSGSTAESAKVKRVLAVRLLIFVGLLVCVAGGGLVYDYSRPPIYRASARLSVEPPGVIDDLAKTQFALNEAQTMRRSDLLQTVLAKLLAGSGPADLDIAKLERSLSLEHVPQTSVVELRAEGSDRNQLVSALTVWIDAYTASRKEADREEGTDALDEARHAAKVAQQSVDAKHREMEAFRQRHGIASIEREENPSAARLKGLHAALNEAAAAEVKAEARLKATRESLEQGRGVIRESDKPAIAGLEMRAVELRERIKDLELDYTQQFLALEPKFKALKANLNRIEQQIEQDKERSRKAALIEAQDSLSSAQQAAQKIREQADSLSRESQTFSTRFVELKRLGTELEQLQETRSIAFERQTQLESARKPSEVRIRLLSAPSASESPTAPDYSRDAAIALAVGLALAIIGVWLYDYLRRDSDGQATQAAQPLIQIAYPMLQPQVGIADPRLVSAPSALLGTTASAAIARELTQADVSALWTNAPAEERLLIAAIFAGIAPIELAQLRWSHVDFDLALVHVPGASARALLLVEPMQSELKARFENIHTGSFGEIPLFADRAGNALDESLLDGQIACVAHDAGLRHPEEVTVRSLHFTYAAYLARQGMRMVDLVTTIGRVNSTISAELMRVAPSGLAVSADRIERVYPGLVATPKASFAPVGQAAK